MRNKNSSRYGITSGRNEDAFYGEMKDKLGFGIFNLALEEVSKNKKKTLLKVSRMIREKNLCVMPEYVYIRNKIHDYINNMLFRIKQESEIKYRKKLFQYGAIHTIKQKKIRENFKKKYRAYRLGHLPNPVEFNDPLGFRDFNIRFYYIKEQLSEFIFRKKENHHRRIDHENK